MVKSVQRVGKKIPLPLPTKTTFNIFLKIEGKLMEMVEFLDEISNLENCNFSFIFLKNFCTISNENFAKL